MSSPVPCTIPTDPVEATGVILRATRDGVFRRIGLGHVTTPEFTRWFAVNAGLGMDAQIIASMEQQRTRGHRATPLRYFVTTVSEYFGERDGPEMHGHPPGICSDRGRRPRDRAERFAVDLFRRAPDRPLPPRILRDRTRPVCPAQSGSADHRHGPRHAC